MRVEADDLRIVDEPLLKRVQARRRLNEDRTERGRLCGAPLRHET
jgi:hypothetical protein